MYWYRFRWKSVKVPLSTRLVNVSTWNVSVLPSEFSLSGLVSVALGSRMPATHTAMPPCCGPSPSQTYTRIFPALPAPAATSIATPAGCLVPSSQPKYTTPFLAAAVLELEAEEAVFSSVPHPAASTGVKATIAAAAIRLIAAPSCCRGSFQVLSSPWRRPGCRCTADCARGPALRPPAAWRTPARSSDAHASRRSADRPPGAPCRTPQDSPRATRRLGRSP